jgi:capsular exopolysaccharide synthesis family protein
MTVAEFFRAIRKRWPVLAASVAIGLMLAAIVTAQQTPMYQASVTFFVSTPAEPGSSGSTALALDQFTIGRVNSYIRLLSSDAMAQEVIQNASPQVTLTVPQISKEIAGSAALNTVLLKATVTDSSPARAKGIAGAIANRLGPLVAAVDAQAKTATNGQAAVQLKVISGPTVGTSPVSPRKALNYGLGLILGLVVGLIVIALRELTDTSVRTPEELQDATGVPVLASVGYDKAAKRSPLIVEIAGSRSLRAEEYRRLRTNLQFISIDEPVRAVAVTSSVAGEGKSSTAVNLAIVMSESGKRVLLIEADLRRPRISSYLGLENALGLTNVLAGQMSVDEALQDWGTDGLKVLSSGSIPPNPSELLGSRAMAEFVRAMRERFDLIVLDTPPLGPVTDAAIASSVVDGVVLVVRAAKTHLHGVDSSMESLAAVDARVLGTVLSMVPGTRSAERRYASYSYGYADENMSRREQRQARKATGAAATDAAQHGAEGQPNAKPRTKRNRPAKPGDGTAQGGEVPRGQGAAGATATDTVAETGKAGSGSTQVPRGAPARQSSGAANTRGWSQPAGKDPRASESGALAVPPRD